MRSAPAHTRGEAGRMLRACAAALSQAPSSSPSLHGLRCTEDVGPGRWSQEATEQGGIPVPPPSPAIPFLGLRQQ